MPPDLIPVAEARARIVEAFSPLPGEQVPVPDALGRVLATSVTARRTQPPVSVSAMDGYAARAADVAAPPVTLRRIGVSAAGGGFAGVVGPGETVRIFTGAPVPKGADTIVIQENTTVDDAAVTVAEASGPGRYIRRAGLDFSAGDAGPAEGQVLGARDIALAAAMNHPWLTVRRRPRVAILATGDEIVMPGEPLDGDRIVSSNSVALAAVVRTCGGLPVILGVAPDEKDALSRMARGARGHDMLVTTGGVSVGERDLVREVLGGAGMTLDFWRIAMRPGKPLMFGRLEDTPVLGLPGNPVSALVCALIFLRPALGRLLGIEEDDDRRWRRRVSLARALPANDRREDYLRSALTAAADGGLRATPFDVQDSSMLSLLARSDCLVIRPPHAPPAAAGDEADALLFPGGPDRF